MTKKPNIVLFFADDQRHNTIAALGNKEIGAICMLNRAMLHTWRTLFHLYREGQQIPSEHVMLGEALQESGYRTFGTGKWHNGSSSYARSFTDGGEIFFGGMQDHWNVPAHRFDPTGEYVSRTVKKLLTT